jgi:hypothetical protein
MGIWSDVTAGLFGSFLPGNGDAVSGILCDLVAQGSDGEAQQASGRRAIALGSAKRFQNQITLDVFNR